MGHNQIKDAYLLALAVARAGTLATLDHQVALNAVRGAQAKPSQAFAIAIAIAVNYLASSTRIALTTPL